MNDIDDLGIVDSEACQCLNELIRALAKFLIGIRVSDRLDIFGKKLCGSRFVSSDLICPACVIYGACCFSGITEINGIISLNRLGSIGSLEHPSFCLAVSFNGIGSVDSNGFFGRGSFTAKYGWIHIRSSDTS